MGDIEKLIEMVRSNHLLYDLSNKDYKNIKKKDKLWDEIAKQLGGNGDDIKKKWKNLRDSYSKHLRSEKTHTGQETKILDRYKTWPWAQQMEFLRPFLQFSKTDSNISIQSLREQQDEKDDSEAQENSQLLHETNPASAQQETPIVSRKNKFEEKHAQSKSVQPQQVTPSSSRKRKSEETPSQSTSVQQVLNYLENRQSNNNSALDDIDLIFMGYAKTVKKFSLRRQTMVKFKVSQILMEAELAEQDEQEQPIQGGLTFNRPISASPGTSSGTSLSRSLLSPIESETFFQSRPEANKSAESWYSEFGSSLYTNI